MQNKIKPVRLKPGDQIGITAPASWPYHPDKAERGIKRFEQMGFRTCVGRTLYRKHGYLAGTDKERLDELHQMFADSDIQAIFCVGGGYGSPRIAEALDYDLIRANPKIFWGFSDITFLLNAIYQRTGLITFHGPMVGSDFGRPDEELHPLTLGTIGQLLEPMAFVHDESIAQLYTITEGQASGELVGGNLSLIVNSLGTPFELDTRNKLLLIEEIEEDIYRVDRMLNQLRLAGKFDEAAGIVFGDFNNCQSGKRQETLSLIQVFHDHVASSGKPAMGGFRIGHCTPNLAVPIGAAASMNTSDKTLRIDEPGVR